MVAYYVRITGNESLSQDTLHRASADADLAKYGMDSFAIRLLISGRASLSQHRLADVLRSSLLHGSP
jgi:hypothetical protein